MVGNHASNNHTSRSEDQRSIVAALRQRILSLTPEQQARFRQQLEAKGISWEQVLSGNPADKCKSQTQQQTESKPLSPRPDKVPLSASQQHLWVVHKLYPETCAYHIAMALRMEGELNIPALQHSLQKVVDRHEALRTVFLEDGNQPYLKVLPAAELTLPVTDLVSEDNQSLTLEQWQQQLVKTPFDPATGPLMRAQLFQLSPNKFELVLVLHHLIADGWSRGILLRELATYYRSLAYLSPDVEQQVENLSQLPTLTIQYPDYVLKQQEWLTTCDYQQQLSYWKQQLLDLPELDLQTKLPEGAQSGSDYISQTCLRNFSASQSQAIKRVAQQSGTTVFVLLLAAFKLLLHRYSRQLDIAVGIPVAGRSTAATESLIGFFVNTLVLRTQVDCAISFSDWLRQVQVTLADALQYQEVPFAKVVDAIGVQRTPGQNPLFRVMFQVQSSGYELQNAEQLDLQLPNLAITQQWIVPSETKFDMSWHVIERDGKLLVAVEYRQALFEHDRIERMLTHFQTLIDEIVIAPNSLVKDLSLLTLQEKAQMLTDWSQGKSVNTPQKCFPTKFEQQVDETPNAIAVVDSAKQTSLTYQQLNQRANKLAHWLRSQRTSTDAAKHLVGLYLPPGIDLMTAIIASLKASGTYIPLDVTLPQVRVQHMLKDTQPSVLITHGDLETPIVKGIEQHKETSQDFSCPTVFSIDKEEHQLSVQPGHNLTPAPSLEQLAYITYTSGSTGKPKGTQITHRGLSNYLNWCLSAYPVTEGCGAPVQSSIGFDATITSLFSPLLVGKQVVFNLADHEVGSIQSALSGGFSFIKLTPAHLSALQPLIANQSLERNLLPKALIIGGEALHSYHIEIWQRAYPEVSLFNEYGPTEATVGCCVHTVTQQDRGNIPIGKPIDGARLYVLDEARQLVPPGIAGELYIGGLGVAVGYFNRPTLTEDKFVQDPFLESNDLSAANRLYKTGDIVRYQTDGTLEYLGRIDSQIKLRGFRIEPGEIEALLCQHPLVTQAVVVIAKQNTVPQLAAYVVSDVANISSSEENSRQLGSLVSELLQRLRLQLPSYMVPVYITVLKTLPLTSNGKIDRSALPDPTLAVATANPVQPRNEKEQMLATIWQQILGQSLLSIYDNFFDLGGDSISAMQIVSKASEQGLKLTPSQLFQYQTIAEQAAIAQVITITREVETLEAGEILLAPSQQDFFVQNRPAPHHYNQALLLIVKQTVHVEMLQIALEKVAQHHDAFQLRYEKTQTEKVQTEKAQTEKTVAGWQQRYAESASFAFEEVDLTHSAASLIDVMEMAQSSLNLEQGPLFKAVLIHLASRKRLLLVSHHLIVDGVSWRILLSDLLVAYRQLQDEQIVTLPPRTAAFGTWTQHLQTQVNSADLEAEVDYWADVCAQSPLLPVEQPGGQNTVADVAQVLIETEIKQTRVVKSLGSVDAVLLAVLGQTLRQWSQQNEIVVDIEGHGRKVWDERIDLTRTMGWFTARYPFRLKLPSSSLEEQVSHVVRQLKQVPNQGVGYGMLRTYADASNHRVAQLASPAQVSFNYLGQLVIEPNEAVAGLAPEPIVAAQAPVGDRTYLFEIIALIQADQLQIRWCYSQRQYRRETIKQLCQQFSDNLRSLLVSRQRTEPNSIVPVQFSASPVESRRLSQLLGKLKAREERSS